MYIYTHTCISIYLCICICICTYIKIFIYICRYIYQISHTPARNSWPNKPQKQQNNTTGPMYPWFPEKAPFQVSKTLGCELKNQFSQYKSTRKTTE